MPAKKKTKTRKKSKSYQIELSIASIFFWSLGLFLFLGWIFVLGIFVGRGFLSQTGSSLQTESSFESAENTAGDNKLSDLDVFTNFNKDPKFKFYDELSQKKEAAAKKNHQLSKKKVKQAEKKKTKPSVNKNKQARVSKPKTVSNSRKPLKKGGAYTVQIASLETKIMASKLVNRLLKRGYPTYYFKVNLKGKTFYRVRCGNFDNRKQALALKRKLTKEEKISGFVARNN
ncbi:MAG: SPOR domain-containing protein [Deltaproteobacteria bacterium]|nr:SPOR domain-containing protein [Deltaproteobacteria bacterium]